jgi:hypothetical protein
MDGGRQWTFVIDSDDPDVMYTNTGEGDVLEANGVRVAGGKLYSDFPQPGQRPDLGAAVRP